MVDLGYKAVINGVEYPFAIPHGHGAPREKRLHIFSWYLKQIGEQVGFKISARGWCYQLEGFRLMDKGDFGKVNNIINECRKKGYLPLDFVMADATRNFKGIERPNTQTPETFFKGYLRHALTCYNSFTPDWLEDEEYYIQVWVEKIDLVTLFKPVCKDYHIPIGNSKGWSSILQRAGMLARAEAAEDRGLTPVILYCGDHDPYGLVISNQAMKNFYDLQRATRYNPHNIIFERFGLNEDFIEENELTWIDNIESGSGQVKYDDPVVQEYIRRFGEKKCEANAMIVKPIESRQLMRDAIEKYLGSDAVDRMKVKKAKVREMINDYITETGINDLELVQEILNDDSVEDW